MNLIAWILLILFKVYTYGAAFVLGICVSIIISEDDKWDRYATVLCILVAVFWPIWLIIMYIPPVDKWCDKQFERLRKYLRNE